MPHSTRSTSATRVSSLGFPGDANKASIRSPMEKFPDHTEPPDGQTPSNKYPPNPIHTGNGYGNDRWQPRRDSAMRGAGWSNGTAGTGARGHDRQKSLSDAFKTIRTRRASVSANVHEISDALKAPVSPRLIILCIIWYMSSALTNTSSKAILNAFPKPATLTMIQFAFVASFCLFFSWLSTVFPNLKNAVPALRHGIRYPSREVIVTTLPLAAFQIGGHLLSSTATAKIPVSLVHTIKGLSPLFTVFAYRIIFDIRYPLTTYLSLIPLTLGVMLACSAEFRGNIFGILYAFLAAIIFVTQNIFSKRLFNEAKAAEAAGLHTQTRKLDKLNLLCYSSGLAFLLTSPIWFWSEGLTLLLDFLASGTIDLTQKKNSFDHGRLTLEFVFNGTFHFGQNIIAFVLLSMVSPVTYSVASLIKRVFVVVIAIIWFQNPTTKIQGLGIALTFFGLYLYDRTNENSKKADRKAASLNIKPESILPLSNLPNGSLGRQDTIFESPISTTNVRGFSNSYALSPSAPSDDKKSDDGPGRGGRARGASNASWLPPGTRQEETWRPRENGLNGNGMSVLENISVN
ncbi:triose-phosphate transporter family-domain-containing protein [Amylocarpus encephaloides]|uniref:Triose-phosphate transporter family-domain-containing protein n=1 Tax=Amylocarpus encephaloides TaxID=45428 RepID=A0A9P8C799_9HELO|nr:triose-phosphate transporter family-domain-containing protein [Amylocarpus encephaloides]